MASFPGDVQPVRASWVLGADRWRSPCFLFGGKTPTPSPQKQTQRVAISHCTSKVVKSQSFLHKSQSLADRWPWLRLGHGTCSLRVFVSGRHFPVDAHTATFLPSSGPCGYDALSPRPRCSLHRQPEASLPPPLPAAGRWAASPDVMPSAAASVRRFIPRLRGRALAAFGVRTSRRPTLVVRVTV